MVASEGGRVIEAEGFAHALRLSSQKGMLSLAHGPRTSQVCPPSSTRSRFAPDIAIPSMRG